MKKQSTLFSLLWVMLFEHTSLNIAFPVLTLLFFDVQSSLFAPETSSTVRSMWYGFSVAVPHIINIVTTPMLSVLSDHYGRKKILIVGTLGAWLFAITAAIGILWGSLAMLFIGLSIRGAFSRTNPIAQAAIGDICDKQQKVVYMGYLQTAISIGAFVGPVLGGYFANQFFFNELNFSLPYWIAAIFAAMSCLLAMFFFQETLPVSTNVRKISFHLTDVKKILCQRDVLMISLVLLLCQFSWSLYYQFIPPILKNHFHFNAHQLGLFVGMIALWLALATSVGIKLLDSFFSFKTMLISAVYFILIGLLATFIFCYFQLFKTMPSLIWIAAIPTAIGDVIAYSCLITLYSNVVSGNDQGKVMGVCFIVVALMWALTGVLGGLLMSVSVWLPLIVAPAGIVGAVMVLSFCHSFSGFMQHRVN